MTQKRRKHSTKPRNNKDRELFCIGLHDDFVAFLLHIEALLLCAAEQNHRKMMSGKKTAGKDVISLARHQTSLGV